MKWQTRQAIVRTRSQVRAYQTSLSFFKSYLAKKTLNCPKPSLQVHSLQRTALQSEFKFIRRREFGYNMHVRRNRQWWRLRKLANDVCCRLEWWRGVWLLKYARSPSTRNCKHLFLFRLVSNVIGRNLTSWHVKFILWLVQNARLESCASWLTGTALKMCTHFPARKSARMNSVHLSKANSKTRHFLLCRRISQNLTRKKSVSVSEKNQIIWIVTARVTKITQNVQSLEQFKNLL